RVLRNQVDLLHALADELSRLGHDALDRTTAMPAADLRDDAEGAGVIAAFGDFQVREMFRREAEPRRVVIRNPGRATLDERGRPLVTATLLRVHLLDDRRDLR